MIAAMALASALARVTVNVDVTPKHALQHVVPMRWLGAALDAQSAGVMPTTYGPADVAAMLDAGLGPVAYRLNTELSVQDWHWNPAGTWSDSGARAGYWTGSSLPGKTIGISWGYDLPDRGFTHDQGYNLGYSRLDDGNLSTYWKSNPYLSRHFDGESDRLHAQWIVVDLGDRRGVDAIALHWDNPYAVAYRVQYWTGSDAIYAPAVGRWADFPQGVVTNGRGGAVTLQLASAPMTVRYVRVSMSSSSNTCDAHGAADPRNCLGYAIDEVGIGTLDDGTFADLVKHAPDRHQSVTYASSVDPWHASADRARVPAQPGFDAVFKSGITRGLPALVPVSLLYGTPDDAVAEIAWLEARGDKLRGVELGEEPDGQFVLPEDYGALYVQWAKRLHALDPKLVLGGPAFQGTNADVQTWPDASGDASWLHRFVKYLSARGMLPALQFMSFEHYPYAACVADPYSAIESEPRLAANVMQVWRRDGVPSGVPFVVDETNYSGDAVSVFQDVPGALWFADMAGAFLSGGASAAYLYQYAPEPIQRTTQACDAWGSYGMFAGNGNYTVGQRTAQFFAATMLASQWAQPIDATHAIYPAVSTSGGRQQTIVTSYAIARPDGTYAVMLVNKDPLHALNAVLAFSSGGRPYRFAGTLTEAVFGRAQYVWHGNGPAGYAAPDGPIAVRNVRASESVVLEPGSITVVRGRLRP